MKTCSRCHITKPLSEFLVDERYKFGVTGWCRACKLNRGRERAAELRNAVKRVPKEKQCSACEQIKPSRDFSIAHDKMDGLASRCKECRRRLEEPQRRHQSLNAKRLYLKQHYGMSLDDMQAMLEHQHGHCAICDQDLKNRPNIDHSHITRRVRGLLCYRCNTDLRAVENADFMTKALAYLAYHAANPGPFQLAEWSQTQRRKRLVM